MGRVRRTPISVQEKAELWARWRRGESLTAIARAPDRGRDALYPVVAAQGGIPPPPGRGRAGRCARWSAKRSRAASPGSTRCDRSAVAGAAGKFNAGDRARFYGRTHRLLARGRRSWSFVHGVHGAFLSAAGAERFRS